MDVDAYTYFFYEWLILRLGMSMEEYNALSIDSLLEYKKEFDEWLDRLN